MNYAQINPCDTANGKGVRVSLFVSGCTHHCQGCFNQELWDYGYGKPFTTDVRARLIKQLDKPYIAGLSILGGDPMCQSNSDLIQLTGLCVVAHALGKDVWLWTGYRHEDIPNGIDDWHEALLNNVDVLVDGRYEADKRDVSLAWRGSSNQRVIDMNKTRLQGKVILYE